MAASIQLTQTANVAVHADVGKVVAGRVHLPRVTLAEVLQPKDVLLPAQVMTSPLLLILVIIFIIIHQDCGPSITADTRHYYHHYNKRF